MKSLFFVVLILLSVPSSKSGNILVILPTTLRSHMNVFRPIVNILSTEHKITFYSVRPLEKSNENVTQKFLTNSLMTRSTVNMYSDIVKSDQYHQFLIFLKELHVDHFNLMLQGSDLPTLNSTVKYDLCLIINIFSEPFFKLAHIYNIPLIQVVTSIPLPWNYAQMYSTNNLGYDISFITSEESYSYKDRFKKFIKHIYTWYYYEYVYLSPLEKLAQNYFPTPATIRDIAQNTEALLVNYISAMGYSRPNPSNIVEIGCLHCKSAEKLPENIESFIENAGEHGVIYFSLGTTVTDLVLSKKVKESILNVLSTIPQRVLWKLDEDLENVPVNVMISKWFPQQDILGHNKTKLFISQGGMLSMQESAFHGIPVLIIPLMGDQFSNALLAEKKGYAKVLELHNFNEEQFQNDIQELIYNQKYQGNAKIISRAIKNEPMRASLRLKEMVNFVIENKNTSVFRPMTSHLSLCERFELDLFISLILIIIILLITIFYICNKFYIYVKHLQIRKMKAE